MARVSSRPPQPLAKSERLPQHQHGVFTQVANETCTFNRYVTLSVLWNEPALMEVSFLLLSLHFCSYLDRNRKISDRFVCFLMPPQHGCPVRSIHSGSPRFAVLVTNWPRARPRTDPTPAASASTDTPETGPRFARVNINTALSPALTEGCLRWMLLVCPQKVLLPHFHQA